MIATSRQEQIDIEWLLQNCSELSSIRVNSLFRGTTESEVDMHLQGVLVPSGKLAGAIILVMQPTETARDKNGTAIVANRIHTIRIIEAVMNNRLSGWETDVTKLVCGYTCDELKDIVKMRLHNRRLNAAPLMYSATKEYADPKGGLGYDIEFTIVGELPSESRNGVGITRSGTTVTIIGTGAAGEVLRYTTDGSAPVPGGATVSTYSAPFTAASGVTVRASATATSLEISDFHQVTIP